MKLKKDTDCARKTNTKLDYLGELFIQILNQIRKANGEHDCDENFNTFSNVEKDDLIKTIENIIYVYVVKGEWLKAVNIHNIWFNSMKEKGWVYGVTKDYELKTHPCLIPFNDLNFYQKLKDEILLNITYTLLNDLKDRFLSGDLNIFEISEYMHSNLNNSDPKEIATSLIKKWLRI